MLVIRAAQMNVLENEIWRRFLSELCSELQRSLDHPPPGHTDLLPRIERAVGEARAAGIRDLVDLRRFALVIFAHLPETGHDPLPEHVLTILADQRLTPASRVERLETMFLAAQYRRKYPRRNPSGS